MDHPAVHRVRAALAAAGATRAAEAIRALDSSAHTAQLAADQLGVEVGQIANSLVFVAAADGDPAGPGDHGELLLILTSGAHRVDTATVAATLGVPDIRRADAESVRARTGFAIGGVAPVGHTEPVRTLVDVALEQYDQVWAAAGHAATVFPTTYDELVAITAGMPVAVEPGGHG
jgi:prolyl-tRNA editing enzyme YbaK/EbsC (Cys-tRNA(Pro) deacylase)